MRISVGGQLLHDLTVHLVPEDLILEWTTEYLVRQLIAGPQGPGGKVAHVLEDGGEDHDGLLGDLLLVSVHQRLEERKSQWISRMSPKFSVVSLVGGGGDDCSLST